MGKNAIIFGADMSSSVHIDNEKRNILILHEEPTQGLDDTILTEEAIYPTNFIQLNKRFVLSLHNNESNSFLYVNVTIIYQFKSKDSEIKDSLLCLSNTSKNFTTNNIKKTRLKESANFFSVDFNPIDTNAILETYKYLMKQYFLN